jgi:EAL domain-containing protein (putative c-di-GMP-specific phosphodiesterase class I)
MSGVEGLDVFRRVLAQSTQPVALLDREGGLLWANAAAREFLRTTLQRPLDGSLPTLLRDAYERDGVAIMRALEQYGVWRGDVVLTTSRGRDHSMTVEVLAHCDDAGAVDFYSVVAESLVERPVGPITVADDLERAIADGELRAWYQPIFSVATQHVVGFEALVRWEHPERGLLPPSEFIGVAEATGLVKPLGSWMLRTATAQVAEWRRCTGRELTLSVNLNAHQVEHDLVAEVRSVVQEFDLVSGTLAFEIVESVVLDDVPRCAAVMEGLRALGVDLVIDDFGTGYATLDYLRNLPVSGVKIDRQFVGGLGVRHQDAAIVSAVVALAHRLGLTTVAEGVEEPAQLELLRTIGCDAVQGFLLARPGPPERFDAGIDELVHGGIGTPDAALTVTRP